MKTINRKTRIVISLLMVLVMLFSTLAVTVSAKTKTEIAKDTAKEVLSDIKELPTDTPWYTIKYTTDGEVPKLDVQIKPDVAALMNIDVADVMYLLTVVYEQAIKYAAITTLGEYVDLDKINAYVDAAYGKLTNLSSSSYPDLSAIPDSVKNILKDYAQEKLGVSSLEELEEMLTVTETNTAEQVQENKQTLQNNIQGLVDEIQATNGGVSAAIGAVLNASNVTEEEVAKVVETVNKIVVDPTESEEKTIFTEVMEKVYGKEVVNPETGETEIVIPEDKKDIVANVTTTIKETVVEATTGTYSLTDIVKLFKSFSLNDEEILWLAGDVNFELSVQGILSALNALGFNKEPVIAELLEIPTFNELANFSVEDYKSLIDFRLGMNFYVLGDFKIDVNFGITGTESQISKIKAVVSIIDSFVDIDISRIANGGEIALTFNIPDEFATIILKAIESGMVPDHIMLKVFDYMDDTSANDLVAFISERLSVEDIVAILQYIDYETLIDIALDKDLILSLAKKFKIDGILGDVTNDGIDGYIQKAADILGKYYEAAMPYVVRVAEYADVFFPNLMNATLGDIYDGNGKFQASTAAEITEKRIEKVVNAIFNKAEGYLPEQLDKYAKYLDSANNLINGFVAFVMDGRSFTIAADVTVNFANINKVTYVYDGKTVTGFLPAGANVNFFGNNSDAYCWMDNDTKNVVTTMPDKDVVLVPVDDKAISINLDDILANDKEVREYKEASYELTADVILSGEKTYKWYTYDESGVPKYLNSNKVLYVKDVSDSGTYWCEITVEGVDEVFVTKKVELTINPMQLFIKDVALNKDTLEYNGAEQTVEFGFTITDKDGKDVTDKYINLVKDIMTVDGITSGENATSYEATLTFGTIADTNYVLEADDSYVKSWTITPKKLVISDVALDYVTLEYNTAIQTVNFTFVIKDSAGNDVTVTYIDLVKTVMTVSGTSGEDATSYEATLTFGTIADTNYVLEAADSYVKSWTITAQPIDVSKFTVKFKVTGSDDNDYTAEFIEKYELTYRAGVTYTVTLVLDKGADNGVIELVLPGLTGNVGADVGSYEFSFEYNGADTPVLFAFVEGVSESNYTITDYDKFWNYINANFSEAVLWFIEETATAPHNCDFTEFDKLYLNGYVPTCAAGGQYVKVCKYVDGDGVACGMYEGEDGNPTDNIDNAKKYDEPALPHTLVNVDGKPATYDEDGYTAHKVCSVCGYTEGYFTLPKLQNVNSATPGVNMTGEGANKFDISNVTDDYKDFKFPKGTFAKGLKGEIILAYDFNPNNGFVNGEKYKIVFDIPADYVSHGNLVIYHIKDDGTLEPITCTVENGQIIFEATSFSVYALVAVEERSNWWVWLIIILGAMLVAGAIVVTIIAIQRKKAVFAADDKDAAQSAPVVAEAPQTNEGETVDTTPSVGEAAIEVSELTSAQAESPETDNIAEDTVETEPVEEIPAEETVEEAPVVEEVVEEAPVEEVAPEAPVEEAPVEETPVEEVVEEAPVEAVVEEAPVEEVVEEAPVEEVAPEAPVEEVVEETPVEEVVEEAPVEEVVEEAPVEELEVAPVEDVVEEVPVADEELEKLEALVADEVLEIPTEEVALETPVEEVAPEAPVEEVVEEAPVEEVVEEAPVEEVAPEAPVEEVVEEAPVEEVVEEAPVEEVAPEAPVEEVVEEAPVEEVVEEAPVEEVVEEAPVEEVVEEAPVEEVAPEAPVEEVVEETPVEEVVEEAPVAAVVDAPVVEEDSIVVDGEVIYIHYRSSFTSRFIQASETLQNYYTTIKNYILSYTGIKAKTSWNYEVFTKGRTQCVKLNIKGKSLTLNLALDPKEYSVTKYHFTDLSDNPKFANLPMLLKVKSDRGLKYALELIAEVMSKLGIEQGEVPTVDYSMPYETNASLAKRGIVKVILPAGVKYDPSVEIREANVSDIIGADDDKTVTREEVFLYDNDDVADVEIEEVEDASVAESVEAAEVEAEAPVAESVEETAAVTETSAPSTGMPIISSDDTITVEGNVVLIRYRSSFTSRLIQAADDVQDYYTALKNHLLSYKGIKSRTSWNYETFAKGRTQCARINIKGKTLTINLALLPESYNVNKYHFTDLSDNPKFDKLPMLLKVRSARALKYAMELIDELMKNLGVTVGKIQDVDYHKPYETNSELARRGLMKIILPAGVKLDASTILREENVDSLMDSHKQAAPAQVAEAAPETPVEEVVETPVEEVVEETPVEEVVEEAPVEEVVEETPVEEVVEETPVEEVAPETPVEEVVEETPVEEVVEEAPVEEVVEEAPVEEVVEETPVEEVVEEAPVEEVAPETPVEEVVEEAPVEEVVEETPVEEVVEETPVEEVVEETPVEEVVEETPVEEVVEETPVEEVVEEAPVEEVVEEAPVEEVVEEAPVEEVVEETPVEEVAPEAPVEDHVFTDAQHADAMVNDYEAEHSIEVIKKSRSGKMVEINIDDICANFEDGDVVTLEALKAKRLVNKAAGRIKVLAKGTMTKCLTIEADKFSLQAVKMITLAGGTAKRYN